MLDSPQPKAHLIANTKSGKGGGASLPDVAKAIAAEVGFALEHYPTEDPSTLDAQIDKAVAAAKAEGGVVIAAGGDGTIRAVAHKAAEAGVTFGVVPCGTFNFFARTHNIPEKSEDALRLAMTGEQREVRLGRLNEHYFLINASMGLYARSIQEREANTKRFGRDRLVVILSTLLSFFSYRRNLLVEFSAEGKRTTLKTISIFVGNNALQLRDLKMDVVRCMQRDLLSAVVLKPVSTFERLRILWRGMSKTLEQDERMETFCVDSLTIRLPQRRIMVALDGEMFSVTSPIRIQAEPRTLKMMLPPKITPKEAP